MTYYSCEECGEMINLSPMQSGPQRQRCPVCKEETLWTAEFEAEGGMF